MPFPWTRDEVELIVADYFEMLRAELSGEAVNKTAHNRRLQRRLRQRSNGSIEFKHANISAALLNLGDFPYFDGYKPRSNYQNLLEEVVLERLSIEPDFFDRLTSSPAVHLERSAAVDFSRVAELIEAPPESVLEPGVHAAAVSRTKPEPHLLRKTDFVRIDAENRQLGRMGEEWAYDLRSFNDDGSQRLIEVKTAGLGKYFPYYVSPNGVRVSERERRQYHLYRVFRFGVAPRLFMLHGALSSVCRLEPVQYSARVAHSTENAGRWLKSSAEPATAAMSPAAFSSAAAWARAKMAPTPEREHDEVDF